jgi:hypothetical protein
MWSADPMHTGDDGIAKDFFKFTFGLAPGNKFQSSVNPENQEIPRKKETCIPADLRAQINRAIDAWEQNVPYELGRKVRNLDGLAMWKMRESKNALHYYGPAIFNLPVVKDKIHKVLYAFHTFFLSQCLYIEVPVNK